MPPEGTLRALVSKQIPSKRRISFSLRERERERERELERAYVFFHSHWFSLQKSLVLQLLALSAQRMLGRKGSSSGRMSPVIESLLS